MLRCTVFNLWAALGIYLQFKVQGGYFGNVFNDHEWNLASLRTGVNIYRYCANAMASRNVCIDSWAIVLLSHCWLLSFLPKSISQFFPLSRKLFWLGIFKCIHFAYKTVRMAIGALNGWRVWYGDRLAFNSFLKRAKIVRW